MLLKSRGEAVHKAPVKLWITCVQLLGQAVHKDGQNPGITCARLMLAGERAARRIADILIETIDNNDAAVAACEMAAGNWAITIHFSGPPDEAAVRDLVALASDAKTAQALTFESVANKDWVRASLDALAPVRAGRFVIHGGHDRTRVAANRIGIEIEAALAFGTGHHGTTLGCLLLLDELLRRRTPRRILDLGTGAGVLGIAAARALRRRVLASDIDPRAVAVARGNARRNGAGNLLEVVVAKGFAAPIFTRRRRFDLVLANILANPLKTLAVPMARHLAPQAQVILSGLLPDQTNGVIAAYRYAGLRLTKRIERAGWSSLLLDRQ